MKVKIIQKRAKSIFTKTKIAGIKYTINQYVGCLHSCLYCYAKYLCQWKQYGKWGTWVEVKINAPELVRGKFVKGEVFMSTASDPYQFIEKEIELTKKVLTNMNKNVKLSILTKSNLVLRDVDLFKKFKNISVGLTLNGFKGRLKKILEPFSPTHTQRVQALQQLSESKIDTFISISPIMPELVDVEQIINDTKDFTKYYILETLNLKLSGKTFVNFLIENYPEIYRILTNPERFKKFTKELNEVIKKFNIKAELIKHSHFLVTL